MRITGTLNEDQYTFFFISHSGVLGKRNILDKLCRENKKKHILRSTIYFLKTVPFEVIGKLM